MKEVLKTDDEKAAEATATAAPSAPSESPLAEATSASPQAAASPLPTPVSANSAQKNEKLWKSSEVRVRELEARLVKVCYFEN